MCDHCGDVTRRKEYRGQITCACGSDDNKNVKNKKMPAPKEMSDKTNLGCCEIQATKGTNGNGGCCGAKHCHGSKDIHNCCKDKKSSSASASRKSTRSSNIAP